MTTIGMLSHRKDPRTVFKSYAYAAAAKMEGADFFFFSPGRVNFNKQTILAWVYEKGEWTEKTVPFPDVIYNAGAPMTEKQEIVFEKLRQNIPFTSHSIGDKISVYDRIEKDGAYSSYLIPSAKVTKFDEIIDLLKKYAEIIVKPSSGAQGSDVIYIQQKDDQYIVDHVQVFTKEELKDFIENKTKETKFLSQPFINSKTKNGLAYDFRLHTQKNGDGQWVLTSIYPRIAAEGLVPNLGRGGYIAEFESFLKHEFDEEYYNVKRTLEQFAVQFSTHFEGLYDELLDELGIDVGIDANQKIWIFEVNWRPGPPIPFNLELDVTRNMIRYACYLHRLFS